jgi:hypothetical protein
MIKNIGLVIHFLLEIAAILIAVIWGFKSGTGSVMKIVLGIILPLALIGIWGVFRVPNDPGPAIVATPGWLRFIIEIGIFAFSVWAYRQINSSGLVWIYVFIILLDYGMMAGRVIWLFKT